MIDSALGKEQYNRDGNIGKKRIVWTIIIIGILVWLVINFPAITSYYIQPSLSDEIPVAKPITITPSIPIQPSPIVAVVPPIIVPATPTVVIPMAQPNLVNPTWNQLKAFLLTDKTDELQYVYPTFVCENFARTLQTNAKKAGWRCAIVSLDMTGYTDPYKLGIASNAGHACNAFQTTDKGLVYIDCTGVPKGFGSPNNDKIVDVKVGNRYIPYSLFPSQGWSSKWEDMGLITAIDSLGW